MSVSTKGVMTSYPGTDSGYYREAHLEWKGIPGPDLDSFTVSMWGSLEVQTNVVAALLAINAQDGSDAVFVGTDESGYLLAYGCSGRLYQPYQAPPMTLQWHHYGFRRSGGVNELFIDGAKYARLTCDPSPAPFDRITLFGATAWAQFVGSIASVKLFERALPNSELVAEGRTPGLLSTDSLYACWPLSRPDDLTDYGPAHRDLRASSGFFSKGTTPPYTLLTVKPDNLPKPLPPQPPYG